MLQYPDNTEEDLQYLVGEESEMPMNEGTSKKVASKAGKQLSSPKSAPAQKSVAASALTQAPDKKNPLKK